MNRVHEDTQNWKKQNKKVKKKRWTQEMIGSTRTRAFKIDLLQAQLIGELSFRVAVEKALLKHVPR